MKGSVLTIDNGEGVKGSVLTIDNGERIVMPMLVGRHILAGHAQQVLHVTGAGFS